MRRPIWLMSTVAAAIAAPAFAQGGATAPDPSPAPVASTAASGAVSPEAAAPADAYEGQGEIVVTATRRASPLSDVPIAVTAITAESLQNSGATDLRQLTQLSPSLLVSSSSTEATGGGARIRGIGTVGDNPGLESSVATFIDGVYRNRSGVGLTELGPIERVEVLRGPQGTLFGRNASAGLINIVTARPKFDEEGYAEASYGNYDYWRLGAGFTGPIGEKIAYRVDGIYTKRDGFIKDVISGRDINDRDRWLVRGKLLLEPTDSLSIMLIGDYADRNEECCVGTYLPAFNVTRAADGSLVRTASTIAQIIRNTTSVVPGAGRGQVIDDTYARRTALTPGQNYNADVRDWGVSGEVNYDLGGATLTSITAYRDWRYVRGQDADFSNLDLLNRVDDGNSFTRFKTFSQELRLQGEAFNGKLDWLVGGYYAHEKLNLGENTKYGADWDQFAAALVRANGTATGNALLAAFPGYAALNPFVGQAAAVTLATNPAFAGVPAAARPLVAARIQQEIQGFTIGGTGLRDRFDQTSRNYAFFTHNIVSLTDRLSLTLGARYTNERKTLDAELTSNSACGAFLANIGRLRTLAATAAAGGNTGLPATLNPAVAGLAGGLATQFAALGSAPCGAISNINGNFSSKRKESEWSGTAVLSYKPTDRLLTYASYSRGYKAGGFNLDRAPLSQFVGTTTPVTANALQFEPEIVDAYELGFKYDGRRFDLNVAGFYQMFKSFQLNTFSGTNFFVTDIRGCKTDLGTTDQDQIAGNSQCNNTKAGVTSKGVEIEAFLYPARDVNIGLGFVLADTKFAKNLSGTPDVLTGNNSLQPALSLLPGGRLSNSALYTTTGSASFTPEVGSNLRALFYADFRYTSELNTGSDRFVEKRQQGVMTVNARLGIGAADQLWRLEFWGQNIFNVNYKQIGYSMPLQGSNTSAAQLLPGQTTTQLFGAFLAEPRTYGLTVRTKF